MRARTLFLILLAARLPVHAADDPLTGLRAGHPRLILTDDGLARLRRHIQTDPYAQALHARLVEIASKLQTEPPVEYTGQHKRLLEESRTALERIYTLALLYRLDGTRGFFDRAVRELRTVAGFPDWAPHSYLDTAEMTHAVAIGYDWLYRDLSPADRAAFRQAIIDKGIQVGLRDYDRQKTWTVAAHNSNTVGNAGITIGALAVADSDPELARSVLRKSLDSVRLSFAEFAPDGGWKEGPMYWHYATRYAVSLITALETALGKDFGLSAAEGFSHTGDFRIYAVGPTGEYFNFGDSHLRPQRAWEMWWLARKFSQPVYAWQQKRLLDGGAPPAALDLVWHQAETRSPQDAAWPLDKIFNRTNAAFLRSSWKDDAAVYVAVKGGNHPSVHYQADAGTFVMDAGGVRWASDLGSDSYGLPGYFEMEPDGRRWSYYRTTTASHNTLLIDNENQDPLAPAPVVTHEFSPKQSFVRIDLSKVNPHTVVRWQRTVSLVQRKYVVIEDDLATVRPVEVLWGMVTGAQVTCRGATAELRQGDAMLVARIISPPQAYFDTISTARQPPEDPNRGTRKLVVRLPGKITAAKIAVELRPSGFRGPTATAP